MLETRDTLRSGAGRPDITLQDILNIEDLQKIQDEFALANTLASTITDVQGAPITRSSNHTRLCRIIRSSERGMDNCKRSGRILRERSRELMRPNYHACLSIGLADASAPVIVQGHHMANWLIGQNYVLDVDEKRVREYALEIGVDAEELVQAYLEIPKMSREEFERKLNFLWRLAIHISRLGYKNLEYSRMLEKIKQTEQELRTYKEDLEAIVEERTRKLQEAMEEVKRLSDTDSLTGCFNKGYLKKNLPKELKRAQRSKLPMSVIMCDIDHFKKVNDRYGHQCGDQVLINCVRTIDSSLRRDIDWTARYGGEEFLLVLPNTDLQQAECLARRLKTTVADHTIQWMDHTLSITASFGVSACQPKDSPDLDVETLIQTADKHLYLAKQRGRNQVVSGPCPGSEN